jgi:hypothetical protein
LGVSPCPVVPVGTMGESPEVTLRVRRPAGEQPPPAAFHAYAEKYPHCQNNSF